MTRRDICTPYGHCAKRAFATGGLARYRRIGATMPAAERGGAPPSKHRRRILASFTFHRCLPFPNLQPASTVAPHFHTLSKLNRSACKHCVALCCFLWNVSSSCYSLPAIIDDAIIGAYWVGLWTSLNEEKAFAGERVASWSLDEKRNTP